MDQPKAPDDYRDWDSIDIYLFTNGQDYSPPRKYHLQTEEIKSWDATTNLLALAQFGSLHSNIELYTLDGKKINTPLELSNDAAYVAVKPPDTFVQTGYEKYLLKASRSWEKRQERLNNAEIAKSENIEINREDIKSNLNIPDDGTINNGIKIDGFPLDTKIEHLVKVQNNTFNKSQKDTESLQNTTTNNSHRTEKPELLQRRNPGSNTKNTILKKIHPNSKSKEDGQSLNKKKITSFPKNLTKSNNNCKRLMISSNNTNDLKTNLEEKVKTKGAAQISTFKPAENIIETNGKSEQLRNKPVITVSPSTSEKDFTVLSNVYKDTENDIQSIFLDANRKTALKSNEQRERASALENMEESRETPENCLKTNMANFQQGTSDLSENKTPCNVNEPGSFNINLNINLKSYAQGNSEANERKTYVKILKPEKSSQVNIDVNLSKENLNFGDEVRELRERSAESGIAKSCEEKFADIKVIIHCKCNLLKSDIQSLCNFKENDHYVIIIPAERNDNFMPRSDLETRRGSDKEIQELLYSGTHVPGDKKHESVMRHKVSVSPKEAPKGFNFINNMQNQSQGDIIKNKLINDNIIETNHKIDNFAQTDWCNTLLQAKCNEDGHYTFHIPPLHLLTHYNLL